VIRIRCLAVTGNLGQDFGAAALSVFKRFQHQDCGAFADHGAVSIPREGRAGAFRRVILGR